MPCHPKARRAALAAALAALSPLLGCSGSSDASGLIGGGAAACGDQAVRTNVKSLMGDWYLNAAAVNLAGFDPATSTLSPPAFLDALVASANGPDAGRHYSYLTTKGASSQFFDEGTSLGFGVGLQRAAGNRLFVTQVYGDGMDPAEPNYALRSPAARAGLARGDELIALAPGAPPGPSAAGLDAPERQLSALLLADDVAPGTLSAAFGSSVAGTVRDFRVLRADGVTQVDLQATTALYWLDPVPRYLAPTVLTSPGGRKVGYLVLRAFINPATDALATAFAAFKAQGVTDLIVDLRYDGGGLLDVASGFLGLMGGGHEGATAFRLAYNPAHAAAGKTFTFGAPAAALAPARVAFIQTGASASASELLPFALVPFLGADVAVVGAPSLGKPAGQNLFSGTSCQTVYVILTFQLANSVRPAGYWDGLPDAAWGGSSCAAADDLTRPLGDPAEASTAAALAFIDGGQAACTPIPATGPAARRARALAAPGGPEPTLAQRHVPGLF